ncbi:class II aldolase/adducin family protein [Streptomyces asiaticus]
MPGTSGNLSVRLRGAEDLFLITASGRDKSELTARDMTIVSTTRTGLLRLKQFELLKPRPRRPRDGRRAHLPQLGRRLPFRCGHRPPLRRHSRRTSLPAAFPP